MKGTNLGQVTNAEIKVNQDGDVKRVMLQVTLIDDEDVRQAELMQQAGEDSCPAINSRAVLIDITDRITLAISTADDLTPSCNPGEKEIYATDSPVTKKLGGIKFDKNGNAIINQGTNHAVQYEALLSAFNQLKSDFNSLVSVFTAHVHPFTGTVSGTTCSGSTTATGTPGTASSASMTGSKEATVLLP